jgi:hypothetical protein
MVVMTWVAALMLATAPSVQAAPPSSSEAQAEPQKPDSKHLEQLIRDLGADEAKREKAQQELRQIGKPAIPYLKKASQDEDAERALAARVLLLDIAAKDEKSKECAPDVRVTYQDWAKGIDFTRDESGRITLTVPEPNTDSGKREFKTYKADSIEDFKKQYPQIARKYDVDKMASPQESAQEMREEWLRMKERLGLKNGDEWSLGAPEDLDAWMQKEQQRMEKALKEQDDRESANSSPTSPRFGILIAPIGPALRAQLGLAEGVGLLVHEVEPRSLAEASGVRKFDVLTQFNGQDIKNFSEFRKDLEKALSTDHFSLGLIRAGKVQKVEVAPHTAK